MPALSCFSPLLRHLFAAGVSFAFAWAGGLSAAEIAANFTDAKGAPVADVVISLVPLDAPPKLAPPATPVEIMQRGQEFSPYVTPLVVGTAVSFPNRDTVQHHVYSLSKPRKFELPLYAGEAKEAVVFDHPGIVALGCNIHDWMSAYVVVLSTPFFAKSAADGRAAVSTVPAGRYRAEVWHPRLAKPETRELTVTEPGGEPLAFTLTLKADRRIRRTPASGARGGYN